VRENAVCTIRIQPTTLKKYRLKTTKNTQHAAGIYNSSLALWSVMKRDPRAGKLNPAALLWLLRFPLIFEPRRSAVLFLNESNKNEHNYILLTLWTTLRGGD
jgi:hypothetical protein